LPPKKLEKKQRKEEKAKKAIKIEKKMEIVQKYGVSDKLRALYNPFLL
jgi:hypothetical protein